MIHSSMKTTSDVARQTRKFYLQANLLIRNSRLCCFQVNVFYFRRIVPIYTVVNCGSILQRVMKLSTSHNSVLRRVFSIFFFSKKLPIVVVRDVCPSVRPSVCPSVRPSVRPSVCRLWK